MRNRNRAGCGRRCGAAAPGLALALALAARAAAGHPGHGGFEARLVAAEREGAALRLVLDLDNAGPLALTLRAVRVGGAERVRLVRRLSLLGLAADQAVPFLRIDPGETLRLGGERYRLTVEGLAPGARGVTLFLDFGPDGAVLLPVEIPAD